MVKKVTANEKLYSVTHTTDASCVRLLVSQIG